jgi:hypothetical protein
MLGFREASPIRPALEDADIEAIVAFIRTWDSPNK